MCSGSAALGCPRLPDAAERRERGAGAITGKAGDPVEMVEQLSIEAVVRCLSVIEAVSALDRPAGVSQLSRRVGLPKTTTYRICQSLVAQGFLKQDPDTRRYLPGWRLYGLAARVVAGLDLAAVAGPVLRDLSRQAGGNAFLALLSEDGRDLLVVAEEVAPGPLQIRSCLGRTFGVHEDLIGPACLAAMSTQRRTQVLRKPRLGRSDKNRLLRDVPLAKRKGYHLSKNVLGKGIHSVGVAVVDSGGEPRGVVGMLLPTASLEKAGLRRVAQMCIDGGLAISASLGHGSCR